MAEKGRNNWAVILFHSVETAFTLGISSLGPPFPEADVSLLNGTDMHHHLT